MADIFKEVDEELRRDNAAKLWKKYGRSIVGFCIAVVLAVAAFQAWKAYDLNRRGERSDQFAEALDLAAAGDTGAALSSLGELSDSRGGGYPGLAAFEAARLRSQSGDVDGAIVIWDRMAGDTALGPGFQNLAAILSILHQFDDGDPEILAQRLERLAAEGQAFRASVLELQALLALRQGDRTRARELYTLIADDLGAPGALHARAAQMLQAIGE
ncbi:MAG: tetratricopeptide repeat protein [Kiloniellales bacterium]